MMNQSNCPMKLTKSSLAIIVVAVLAVGMVSLGAVAQQNVQQEQEPNDGSDNATTIEKNNPVSGELANTTDSDTFSYNYQSNENLTIEISVSENATGTLYFYSRAGNGTNFVLGEPGNGWVFVDPGETRTFNLANATELNEGPYYLEVVSTDSTAPDPPEPNSGAYSFTIQTADGENQTQTETTTVTNTPTETTTETETPPASPTDTPTETATETPTATETATETATSTETATETETTTAEETTETAPENNNEPNDRRTNATIITDGAQVSGITVLSEGDTTDWYAFNVTEGQTIQVNGTVSGGAVRLYAPGGDFNDSAATNLLGEAAGATVTPYNLTTTAEETGTYYLDFGGEVTEYDFTLSLSSAEAEQPTDEDGADRDDEGATQGDDLGQNDEDDDGDGHVDEDGEDGNDVPSNDDDDGDGAIDEDDELDDGDDGSDDFGGEAEDDDDGDGHFDEDDEQDGGNSDDEDNDGDGAVDEDDEPDNDD
jgi:cell division septation protein DedD